MNIYVKNELIIFLLCFINTIKLFIIKNTHIVYEARPCYILFDVVVIVALNVVPIFCIFFL